MINKRSALAFAFLLAPFCSLKAAVRHLSFAGHDSINSQRVRVSVA